MTAKHEMLPAYWRKRTGTGSRRYCGGRIRRFLASNICGWMPWLPGRGRGQELGGEEAWGWSVDLVERPRKAAPKEVLMAWAERWLHECVKVDWEKLLPPKGFVALPRRWIVERSFAWISHNRRMSKDYERLCASGEAFVYTAMSRLMLRRLARS